MCTTGRTLGASQPAASQSADPPIPGTFLSPAWRRPLATFTIVNGGTGSVTFENASYVSGSQNLGVLSGSAGIAVGSSLTLGTGTLRLSTTGAITQTAGTIAANTAGLSAATGITLAQPSNDVTTLAAQTTAGNIAFTDTNGFTIGAVSATVDGFHPEITGLSAAAGTITFQSGGAVTQTQRILASALNMQGSGPYTSRTIRMT